MNPARFERSGETVVCIDELMSSAELLRSEYYLDFMRPLNHRYVVDMFFRRDGRIVAVLSVLRAELSAKVLGLTV